MSEMDPGRRTRPVIRVPASTRGVVPGTTIGITQSSTASTQSATSSARPVLKVKARPVLQVKAGQVPKAQPSQSTSTTSSQLPLPLPLPPLPKAPSGVPKRSSMTEAKLRANAWSTPGVLVSDDQRWILHNNQQFGDWVERHYNKYRLREEQDIDCYRKEEQDSLFRYQQFIKEYMDTVSPYRGILLYHGLGSGKTRSSIEVARQYAAEGHMCLFISKAKLIYNFAKELAKWKWSSRYAELTLGQSGTGTGVFGPADYKRFVEVSAGRPKAGRNFLRQWGIGYAAYNAPNKESQLLEYADPKDGKLRNLVIIIDEVHNLVQNIYNGLNHGKDKGTKERLQRYYRLLLFTDNCRFVTLSGTPIINTPKELSVLFNLLRGPIPAQPDETNQDPYELFPVAEQEFETAFIDWNTGRGQNLPVFQRRIQGLVSYYSGARGDVFPTMVDEEGRPINEPIVVEVPMGRTQAEWYELMRGPERDKTRKKQKKATDVSMAELRAEIVKEEKTQGTYRVKSRMAGLFGYPVDIGKYRVEGQDQNLQHLFELLEDEEALSLPDLREYSAKMATVLEKMASIEQDEPDRDGGILIYSNFREVEGMKLMSMALDANGWMEWQPGTDPEAEDDWNGRRYAILGSDAEKNAEIIKVYNSKENLFSREEYDDDYTGAGRLIKVLLGTEVISEGVDLFNIRQVHILEPHWNMVRIEQTIGRARRICSHVSLPRELWNFTAWVYLATANAEVPSPDSLTTDEIIWEIAERKQMMNEDFLHAMKEAAVDCRLNLTHNQPLGTTSRADRPDDNPEDPSDPGGNGGTRIECMTIPRPAELGPDEVSYAYWPNYSADFTAQKRGGERQVVRKRGKIKAIKYDAKMFPPKRFPDLWEGKEPRYLIEVTMAGDRLQAHKATHEGKTVTAYHLYDREAYAQGRTVMAGRLVEYIEGKQAKVIFVPE